MTGTQSKSTERCIFEDLVDRSGLDYLSDLHIPSRYGDVIKALQEIEESDYPRAQWIELFRYILPKTGKNVPLSEKDSLKAQIIEQLKALL